MLILLAERRAKMKLFDYIKQARKWYSGHYMDAWTIFGYLAIPLLSAVTAGITFLLTHGLRIPLIIGISFGTVVHAVKWLFFISFYCSVRSTPPPLYWPTGPNINMYIARMEFIYAMRKKSITKGMMAIVWIALLCWCLWAFESHVFLFIAISIIVVSMIADFIVSFTDNFLTCWRISPEMTSSAIMS
jgi:hypothetical protein